MSLSKTLILRLVLFDPRKTRPNITKKIVDWDVKNQIKQTNKYRMQTLKSHKQHKFFLAGCNLFFGCRNRTKDFYCEEEWKTLEKKGLLTLYTAFSRDQVSVPMVLGIENIAATCDFQQCGILT